MWLRPHLAAPCAQPDGADPFGVPHAPRGERPLRVVVVGDPERVRVWARWLGEHAEVTPGPPDAGDVHALVVASAPSRRAENVIAALEARQRVLVEPPLCSSLLELDAIEAAARTTSAPPIMIAESAYFAPALIRVRKLLVGLGRLTFVRLAGVGPLARAVAMMNEIIGAPPVELVTLPTSRAVLLQFASGTRGEIALAPGHSRIEGENGAIDFDSRWVHARVRGAHDFWLPGLRDASGRTALRADFLRTIDYGWAPYADLEFARRDLEVLFRVRAALAALGTPEEQT